MRYLSFRIKNFKGINGLNFRIDDKPEAKIITLVGLNESGKTTILEALSYWYESTVNSEKSLHSSEITDPNELVPRSKQFNFNDRVEVEATIEIEEKDKPLFNGWAKKYDYEIDWEKSRLTITYTVKHNFKNSQHQKEGIHKFIGYSLKMIPIKGRKKGKPVNYDQSISKEMWTEFGQTIRALTRPVIYYPNFLFEFPDRIYIDSGATSDPKQNFYYRFIQDVLDSIDSNMNIAESLLERHQDKSGNNPRALQSTINRMSTALDGLIRSLNLFDFSKGQRRVVVTLPSDEGERPFIQVQIQEGDDTFDIRERSLGFRWFFTFALLTQFRVKRAGMEPPLFVFDEPASNLHQTAQQRLLSALEKLVTDSDAQVIYATHSHHLISPKRLENTYIVKNEGLNYEDNGDYLSSMTDVKIYKYRNFVVNNPSEIDYFQPILDVLEYSPSKLEYVNNAVIMEGKNDYYSLAWMLGDKKGFSVIPGLSSTKLGTVISLYFGWGKKFIVILDSDKAGKGQKARYLKEFGRIVDDRIFTLKDICNEWDNKSMESLFTDEDKIKIQKIAFPDDDDFDKSKFNTAIQEVLSTSKTLAVSTESRANFKKIDAFITDRLK